MVPTVICPCFPLEEEWIASSFSADGRLGPVSRINDDVIAQGEDLLSHIAEQAVLIPSGKIGPSDGTCKKGVPNKYYLIRKE